MNRPPGFSLIELIIVIAIIGIMGFFVIPKLSSIRGVELKKTSADLGRVIKYVYNKSVMQNKKFRLVYDFESRSISVEYEEEKKEEEKKTDDESGEVIIESEEKRDEKSPEDKYLIEGKFVEDTDMLNKKLYLPKTVKFNGIYTFHNQEISREGKDYTMILPTGFVEKTIIYLEDNYNRIYSIRINPQTGTIKIFNDYIEPENMEW
jgi:general secretion pathway protein H